MASKFLAGLSCFLLTVVGATAADSSHYLTGRAGDAPAAGTRAGLLLAGGGSDQDDAFRWFVHCAGGGDIVVLRASGEDGYNDYLFATIGGVDSVETIVFHDRAAATDPRVLDIIARAEGIFLAGGDQANYVNYWKGTPVAAALDAHVRAGKPLGGSSAGLAVLGQFAYAALKPGDLNSADVLLDPHDHRITLESDFLQLEALRGIITDTHFMARDRLGRSLVFLARLAAIRPPGARLLGIGVDEKTALCVEPDGTARIFSGDAAGRVWLMVPTVRPEILTPGQPLTFRDILVTALDPASTLNLKTLEAGRPAARSTVSVIAGKISPQP